MMLDPISLARLGQIRQQEILEQAAYDRERPALIQWSRLIHPVQAWIEQRRLARRAASVRVATPEGQLALEECPCE